MDDFLKEKNKNIHRENGQAIIGAVLLFLFISSTIVFGIAGAVHYQLQSAIDYGLSRSSYYLAETLAEDVAYRFVKGLPASGTLTLSLDGETAVARVTDIAAGKEIVSTGDWANRIRKVRLHISYGSGGSFFYGVQVGEGGLHMFHTSSVVGNVHSSGPIIASSDNYIYGDALSAGSAGLIDNIHSTSSAYAHTIQNSTIDKDVYYVTLTNTTVGGTLYPNSPDQATTSLPLTDEQIDEWKADATIGGIVTCTDGKYVIDSNITIGPKKIPCDLEISSNPTVTISGAIWVEGNINILNQPVVRVSTLYSNVTIPVIADKPSDRENGSRIVLNNNTDFQGSGTNSYVLLISRNESALLGGSVDGITMANSVSGEVLLYVPHGNVTMDNYVDLREVTAYKLTLRNSAQVIYKSGLANVLFTSGPSGGFEVIDWREVQ